MLSLAQADLGLCSSYTVSILIHAPGALQFIAAKLTVPSPNLDQKRYFDGQNSILHVFSNVFLLEN